MTTRIHLSLDVADLDRSARFYRTLLGEEPTVVQPDYVRFEPERAPLQLALNLAPERAGNDGRVNHVGLRLEGLDELERVRARLLEAGLAVEDERDVVCCYARGTKVWADDPDGARWEVYVIHDARVALEGASACADDSPCCG